MENDRRLIEAAFPIKQASIDSVHEKNVRHGHISTLHIWPARRPLAAARSALIATLLPDPGTESERRNLVNKIGGEVKTETTKSGKVKESTEGGVLHWKREDNPEMDEFRERIREVFDGRAPKVLDPFAGGGAIPLEAMRLGCDTTAIDLNPVAWFILKCTLEYPQKLAGEERTLPDFALEDVEFIDQYLKKQGLTPAKRRDTLRGLGLTDGDALSTQQVMFSDMNQIPDADLSWHVRAWGHWVLNEARKDLTEFYPTYAHFETAEKPAERKSDELRRVPTTDDGKLDMEPLNGAYTDEYLEDDTNPRWVAKPTVAYLWARTVSCKSCRAELPLLKTQWLCRKSRSSKPDKRIRLTMEPNEEGSGVSFGIAREVPKDIDEELTSGTMSRSGATCPCCGTTMTREDLRQEGKAGNIAQKMTAVVIDGPNGKEYRLPTDQECNASKEARAEIDNLYEEIPFGLPSEPVPKGGSRSSGGSSFTVHKYGFQKWSDLFTSRQLLALGTLMKHTRRVREEMKRFGYGADWREAVSAYLSSVISKCADYNSSICTWHISGEKMSHVFVRYALPMKWDFAEANPFSGSSGDYLGSLDWVGRVADHAVNAGNGRAVAIQQSATEELPPNQDAIVTDPPYYDAIQYADLMDFFYVWLRRSLQGLSIEFNDVLSESLSPKWDHESQDGELIDEPSRFDGDMERSKQAYEDGMAEAFQQCYEALKDDGRLCIVFANKSADAWETLVSAIIRAGFVVDASWPIETEMANATTAQGRARLSSSIWIVCRKRSDTAGPGWDNQVLQEMREKLPERLRQFWDAGIRGPDFVWSATGPAMEAYSKHPVVKKADEPGETMDVSEFLDHVRREVVDFAVGRVLSGNGHADDDAESLDKVTAYYLLHRSDYGLAEAPAGACILYSISCGLSDDALDDQYDLVDISGSTAQLKSWEERSRPQEEDLDPTAPLIDQIHRLMYLWKQGDKASVDAFIEERGLSEHDLFQKVLQAIIELSENAERSLLESISNHFGGQVPTRQRSAEQSELFD
jgi:adenine-specific DNA methylase